MICLVGDFLFWFFFFACLKHPRSLSLAADDSSRNIKKGWKKEAEVKAGSVDSQSGISTYKIMLSSRGSGGEATSKWTQAGFTDSPACLKRMHNTMPKAREKDCWKMFRVSSDTHHHEEAKCSEGSVSFFSRCNRSNSSERRIFVCLFIFLFGFASCIF